MCETCGATEFQAVIKLIANFHSNGLKWFACQKWFGEITCEYQTNNTQTKPSSPQSAWEQWVKKIKSHNSFTNSQLLIYSLSYNGIWHWKADTGIPITEISSVVFQAVWVSIIFLFAYSTCLFLNLDQFLPKHKSVTR